MKKIIVLSIIMAMLFLIGCSNKVELTFDEAKVKLENLLESDEAISDFKIEKFEYSHENSQGEKVYLLHYSVKPANPETFVAGNGKDGENGWINELVYFVTFVKNGELIFTTSP